MAKPIKNGPGKWTLEVYLGKDAKGKRIRKKVTGKTKSEVERLAAELKVNFVMQKDIITLRKAFKNYIESKNEILSVSTIMYYNTIVNTQFQELMNINIYDLTSRDLQHAINNVANKQNPSYIKRNLRVLFAVLNSYNINLNKGLTIPKIVKREPVLPPVDTLLDLFVGSEIELPCLLAMCMSMRISEIRGLRYSDIVDNGTRIHIQNTKIYGEHGDTFVSKTKTVKSNRYVDLIPYIKNLIYKNYKGNEDDFIVPCSYSYITKQFKKLTKSAGINMRFHDLRHLSASIMLVIGIPDKYAMEIGGWSSTAVMKTVYQNQIVDEATLARNKLSDYFNAKFENK